MSDQASKPARHGKWGKRFLGLFILFWVVTAAGRIWWGLYADRELQATIDSIRARHEPLEWAELRQAEIPDDRNALRLYQKALDNPLLRPDSSSYLTPTRKTQSELITERLQGLCNELLGHRSTRLKYPVELKIILGLTADERASARVARSLEVHWEIDFDQPASEYADPRVPAIRQLGRVLCLAAIDAHDRGDDSAAFECLFDALAVEKAVSCNPSISTALIGMSVDALACDVVEQMVPALDISTKLGAASEEQTRRLISLLLDRTLEDALTWSLIAERASERDTFQRRSAGSFLGLRGVNRQAFDAVTGPAWTLDEVRALRYVDSGVLSSRKDRFAEAIAGAPDVKSEFCEIPKFYARSLSSMLAFEMRAMFRLSFFHRATRRMAAVAMAVRWFQIDTGHRPRSLEELVPKYLPAVPDDPFSPQSHAIRYKPDAQTPMIYSVGLNGVNDDGGNVGTRYADFERSPDWPFFLDGRAKPPSTWRDPDEQRSVPAVTTTRP